MKQYISKSILSKYSLRLVFLIVASLAASAMLTGCSANKRAVEMPYDPEDSDALRISPCACVEYTEYYNQFGGTV